MKKIQAWRDTISWFVAAVTVALSYEIRNKGFFSIPESGIHIVDEVLPAFLATILLLASLYIARTISSWVVSNENVRAYILKENYVEGFWYLKTDPLENSEKDKASPLSPDGVLWLRYVPKDGDFAVITTRLDQNGESYQVPSKLIHMREEQQRLLYVNYFVIEHEGEHPIEGVSKGRFVPSGTSKIKDRLDAYIFTEGEETRHQGANRISEKEIDNYKKLALENECNNWMEEFLRVQENKKRNN